MTVGWMLLKAVVEEGNRTILDRLDESFFTEEEAPCYRFLTDHLSRHGRLPHSDTLRENRFTLPSEVRETANYYLQRATSRAVYNAVQTRFTSLTAAMANQDAEAITNVLGEMLAEANRRCNPLQFTTFSAQAEILRDYYREAHRNPEAIRGVPLGFDTLDQAILGGAPGDLITIVARPGMGKSWKLLKMANHAHRMGFRPFVVSLEMTLNQIVSRLIGLESGLNPRHIRKGELSMWGEEIFHQTIELMQGRQPMHLLSGDSRRTSRDVERAVSEYSPDIVFVDAAYLLGNASMSKAKRQVAKWEKVAETMNELKGIGMTHNIPVVQTVQFNREVRNRNQGVNLELGSIGSTDEIGQLSSVVAGMLEGRDPHRRTRRTIKGMKNREGESDFEYEMAFEFQPVNMEELEPEAEVADNDLNWMV